MATSIVFIFSVLLVPVQAAEKQELLNGDVNEELSDAEISIAVDSSSNYEERVAALFNEGYDSVDVIFSDLLNDADSVYLTPVVETAIKPEGDIGPVKTYFVKNVRTVPDTIGKKRTATTSGSPGTKISLKVTREVTYSLSATFGAKKGIIYAALNWNVNISKKVTSSASYKVPYKVKGKKVKRGCLDAYPLYKTKKYDVYYGIKGTSYAEKKGTGTGKKLIGAHFKKYNIYK